MMRKGYTLLEVLVATAIFGVAAVGILSALSTSTRNAGRITERDRAVLLARGKMDELLTTRELPKGVPLEGVWDPALTGRLVCGWAANLSTLELAAKNVGAPILERVELVVWCGAGDNRRSFALNGYRRGAISPAEAAVLARQRSLQ